MKIIMSLTLLLVLSSCSGIFGTEKFEIRNELEKGDEYVSEVLGITEQYSDGEVLMIDTTPTKSYLKVLDKSDDYYILESYEEMDESNKLAKIMKLNGIKYKTKVDMNGKLINIINEDELYEALFESITSPIKMVAKLFADKIEDSEEKKQKLAEMDSIFRIGFSKERLLTIVKMGYERSEYSDFIGKNIGEKYTYETTCMVQMIGMVKSKRELIINKTPEGKYHIVVTDTLDSDDYRNKANALSELGGKARKVVADDAEVQIVINNSMIVNPENGITESQKYDMIADTKTYDGTSKKVDKFIIKSLGKKK